MRRADRGGDAELWRRCREIAQALPLPEPFEVTALAATLAQARGRPLELVPLPGRSRGPCGILASTDRADYIGYPSDTSVLHQQHILLHEVGHLLCGHTGATALGSAASEALMPHLSGELIRRVLGRSAYSDRQEQEAELIATLVLQRARHRARAPRPDAGEADDRVARLGSVFGPAPRHPRAADRG
ncbi:ImmA/IrrE family metallo-endopeptidase [Streptomyces sp. Y1]|uniref:ImmA/IrrE family metallo-endopeptidase n=1 Tax=Streptomyces sp. Y1 TaxID=3238634 RepID=A0AB39TGP6_9ACTN